MTVIDLYDKPLHECGSMKLCELINLIKQDALSEINKVLRPHVDPLTKDKAFELYRSNASGQSRQNFNMLVKAGKKPNPFPNYKIKIKPGTGTLNE